MRASKREELDRNPAYQLWLASNAWQRQIRRELAGFDLTHVQFILLASADLIGAEGDIVTQRQICRFADVDENMTSQVVRSLLDKGFLARTPHPDDARAWQVRLTDEGRAILYAAKAALAPVRKAFFAPIEGREEELAHLLRQISHGHDEPCPLAPCLDPRD